jgi:hypothetical protein
MAPVARGQRLRAALLKSSHQERAAASRVSEQSTLLEMTSIVKMHSGDNVLLDDNQYLGQLGDPMQSSGALLYATEES